MHCGRIPCDRSENGPCAEQHAPGVRGHSAFEFFTYADYVMHLTTIWVDMETAKRFFLSGVRI
jgi:hypothetical protein